MEGIRLLLCEQQFNEQKHSACRVSIYQCLTKLCDKKKFLVIALEFTPILNLATVYRELLGFKTQQLYHLRD
jgi:tRNA(Ile)-lysidine synthase TilS/MesJ